MPFWDHLEELRWVILKSLLALVVGIAAAWRLGDPLFELFRRPLEDLSGPVGLIMITPLEGFFLRFRLSVVGGGLLASPFILGFVWSFIAPGLVGRERRIIWTGLLIGLAFFCLGAFLGYLMLSVALPFLHSFSLEGVDNRWSANSYLGFCIHLMLGAGVVFEVPVVLMILVRLDILSASFLRHGRPYAYVIAFILAAILTPPDVITQILVALPLLVTFELSVLYATWREGGKAVE
ncbi:MAG: twin-arginine translocase subunit TatC [Verrucomicrobiota bacterium]